MTPLLHAFHSVNFGAWHLESSVVAGTFIAVSFYIYGVRALGCFVPWRAALYFLGVALMFMALTGPLDTAADRMLSMHMLQHVFLTTIGPPLILFGLPPGLLKPVFELRFFQRSGRFLTNPVVTGTLFIVNMWFWHVPPIYGLALDHLWVHIVMHFAFMGTGLLFWWPVIQPARELGRLSDGARLLYLFATGMPMGLLALLFFASGNVIYSHYDVPDPLWGIDPMIDQQVAGLIMGVLGEGASAIAITLLFFRFLDADEMASDAQQARQRDAALLASPHKSPR